MPKLKQLVLLLAIANIALIAWAIASLTRPSPTLATDAFPSRDRPHLISQTQSSPESQGFTYQAFVVSIKGKSGEEITDFLNQYSDWELVGFDNELFTEANQAIFIFKKPR